MNLLLHFANLWSEDMFQSVWPRLWQSSLLILVVWALDLLLRRKARAAVRYALWMLVLVKLLLPPTLALPTGMAWWIRPANRVYPPAYAAKVTFSPGDPAPGLTEVQLALLARGAGLGPSPAPVYHETMTAFAWASFGWAVVSLGLLGWVAARWCLVARYARQGTAGPESLAEVFDEERRRAGVRGPVRLRISDRPISPAVCGLWRPTILLPRTLLAQISPSDLRPVLLHEFIHLRRGDVWVSLGQALLQVFYWWHPLVWFANARIRRAREEAVDDAVVAALHGGADVYAPTLLAVARLGLPRSFAGLGFVGIFESRSALRRRIERLLNRPAPRRTGLTLASGICVLAFAAFAVPMGPRVVIEADSKPAEGLKDQERDKPDPAASAAPSPDTNRVDRDPLGNPYIISSELNPGNKPQDLDFGTSKASQPAASPRIRFDNTVFEFDKVMAGEPVIHDFCFTNTGTALLVVSNVVPSCGCTTLGAWKHEISPGESGVISVRLNTTNYDSAVAKNLAVFSNDGSRSNITLQLKGIIFKPVGITPSTVVLNSTSVVPFPAATVAITNRLPAPLWLSEPVVTHPAFGASLITNLPGYAYLLTVSNRAALSPRVTEAKVQLKAEGGNAPVIPVFASVPVVPPTDAIAVLLQDGKLLYEMGRLAEAEVKLKAVRATDPGNQAASYYLNLVSEALQRPIPHLPGDLVNRIEVGAYGKITLNRQPLEMAELKQKLLALKAADPELSVAVSAAPDVSYQYVARVLDTVRQVTEKVGLATEPTYTRRGRQVIYHKLDTITMDSVGPWKALPLREVIRLLANQARLVDPDHLGINFMLAPGADGEIPPDLELGDVGITVEPPLRNLRLADVLDVVLKTANHPIRYSIEDYAVVFAFKGKAGAPLYFRTIKVDPNTFRQGLEGVGAPGQGGNPLVTPQNPNSSSRTNSSIQLAAKQFFSSLGVDLAPPKSLFFGDHEGTLLVYATLEDLDKIERAVQVLNTAPPQVHVDVRMYEMPLAEARVLASEYPAASRSPGGALRLTPSQARKQVEAWEKSGQAKLLSRPSIITLSGRQAQVQVGELIKVAQLTNSPNTDAGLIVPETYVEDEVQKRIRSYGDRMELIKTLEQRGTTFEQFRAQIRRELIESPFPGAALGVTPRASTEGFSVHLDLVSSLTQFLGYEASGEQAPGGAPAVAHASPRPRFHQAKTTASVALWDGQSVILGAPPAPGQPLEPGHVPILSEIPLIGDLFRTPGDVLVTNRLVMVITATLIDPAGNRLHTAEEMPFVETGFPP